MTVEGREKLVESAKQDRDACGMTRLDHFAVAALNGMIQTDAGMAMPTETLARMSYEIAEGMLVARRLFHGFK